MLDDQLPTPEDPRRNGPCCDLSYDWVDWQPILLDILHPSGAAFTIPPRAPIALAAAAIDMDAIVIKCTDDSGAESKRTIPVPDTAIIDWRILSETLTSPAGTPPSGPGAAGYLIGAGGRRYPVASGEHALYIPAFVDCLQTLVTEIECRVKNGNTAKFRDQPKRAVITLTIQRTIGVPSLYDVRVNNTQHDDLSTAHYTPTSQMEGLCEPVHGWRKATGIIPSAILGPRNGVLCPGKTTVLGITGSNLDRLDMRCLPDTCEGPQTIDVWDTLEYTWGATAGRFKYGNKGTTVIYEAPPQRDVSIIITCIVSDLHAQYLDAEVQKTLPLRTSIANELDAALRVTRQCHAIESQWHASGDLRAQFAELQTCIAVNVINATYFDRFQDPCAVLRLLTNFIQRFLDAATGKSVPYDWDVAFTEAARLKADLEAGTAILWQILGYLLGSLGSLGFGIFDAETVCTAVVTLLMAYAHITTDLRAALKEEGCGNATDFAAVFQLIEDCETRHVPTQVQLAHDVAVAFGLPLANSIKDWRDSVYAEVCACM